MMKKQKQIGSNSIFLHQNSHNSEKKNQMEPKEDDNILRKKVPFFFFNML